MVLAGRLELGLLPAARDVHPDGDLDLGMQHHGDRVQAELLDRLVEHDLAPVEREAAGGRPRRRRRGW